MEVKSDNYTTFSHQNSISNNMLIQENEDADSNNPAKDKDSSNSVVSTRPKQSKNPFDVKSLNLQADFVSFMKKIDTCKEEEKENFKKILNVFGILLESSSQIITEKLYNFKPDSLKFTYNFYQKGKLKEITLRKGKEKFNFFDYLYQAYNKFNKTNYIVGNTLLELNDILYDMTAFPIIEADLKNKLLVNKLSQGLKYICEGDNMVLALVNDDEFESNQYCYHVLNSYEMKNQVALDEYIVKEGEGNENLFVNSDEIQDHSKMSVIKVNNTLYKIRKFAVNNNLKSEYDYNTLLESRNHTAEEFKELYPAGKAIYTYASTKEIFSSFTRLLLIESKKYEQQINGKFIKCLRDDMVTEYKSRWIYSFNVNSDNFEVTVGIHQNPLNSLSPIVTYLYSGLVVLKSNMSMLNFVDYLPLRDLRQNFLKLKLNRGSYVVVPITSGFYLCHPNEEMINIESINLIENKKDAKTNKVNYDFTSIAKNIIDEIFDKFDVHREGVITFDKLGILYNSIFREDDYSTNNQANEDTIRQYFKPFLDEKENLSLKGFRNFFFSIVKTKGMDYLYKVFKQFGYHKNLNMECRHFFISFHSNEQFEVKLSDGLNNRFNSYAFELYLKHVGTIMNTSNNKYINLIYDQTRDSCNVILMLENKSESEKKVTLEIESFGYDSLNEKTYKNTLKPRECKYLFAIAIGKGEHKDVSQKSLLIKYHIICE